jgi:hypothetical protein
LSTRAGHDSLNLLPCEYNSMPKPAITIMVNNREIVMAIILLIRNRTKKLTTGCSTTAIMMAKTSGTIMLWPKYNIVINANRPTKKMVVFA